MAHSKATMEIDPDIVFFTHSRVRPVFTGCGKRIEETIHEIETGVTRIEDIPLITVIENDGFYFFLNNRRLFMLKRLRSMGLLKGNLVTVSIKPALPREKLKYTVENCSETATFMMEGGSSKDRNDGDEEKEVAETSKPKSLPTIMKASAKVASTIDKKIMNAVKDLKKLMEKGKQRQVVSQLDEWSMNDEISDIQREYLCGELGLGHMR